MENAFDEFKNQSGRGKYTIKCLAQFQLMAKQIVPIYNWWSILVWKKFL